MILLLRLSELLRGQSDSNVNFSPSHMSSRINLGFSVLKCGHYLISPIRMSDVDVDSDVVSEVSEVPDMPKRPKGRPKNAPKGNSVEAGKGKSGKATSRTTFTADGGNSPVTLIVN